MYFACQFFAFCVADYNFADGSYQELEVTNSEFTNCMSEIFDTDTDYDGTISNCHFISREVPEFIKNYDNENKKIKFYFNNSLIMGFFNIADCTFEFGADMGLYALELEEISSVSNCTFVNDERVPAELLQDYTTCIHCKFA